MLEASNTPSTHPAHAARSVMADKERVNKGTKKRNRGRKNRPPTSELCSCIRKFGEDLRTESTLRICVAIFGTSHPHLPHPTSPTLVVLCKNGVWTNDPPIGIPYPSSGRVYRRADHVLRSFPYLCQRAVTVPVWLQHTW